MTLATRRPIVERDFDVDPGWLGPRHLDHFWGLPRPEQRLDAARNARGGGSMPRWMKRRLRAEADAGDLTFVEGDITHTTARQSGVELDVGDQRIEADRCWLATGTRPDVRADPALRRFVDHHIDGMPVIDPNLRVRGTNLFVTGRLASIELGPAAGNLWGARMAARRICRTVTGIDLDRDAVTAIPSPSVATGTTGGAA